MHLLGADGGQDRRGAAECVRRLGRGGDVGARDMGHGRRDAADGRADRLPLGGRGRRGVAEAVAGACSRVHRQACSDLLQPEKSAEIHRISRGFEGRLKISSHFPQKMLDCKPC